MAVENKLFLIIKMIRTIIVIKIFGIVKTL